MEMMPRMAVLDKYDKYLTTIDNNKPESVHFYNENLSLYLQKSATTFEATFENKDDAEYLSVGNKLSFKYKDKDYQLIILKTVETENEITINAIGAGLGLVNNECESLESSAMLSLVDYIRRSDLEGVLKIGINQIPDRKLKISLSSETLLQRIYSLESMFSCEIEIRTVLSDDYSLESFYVDIYKKDVGDQGIGNYRPEIKLEYGRNIESIEKTQDITEMITAVRPIGNNDLNLIGYQTEVRDSDNNILYISPENSGWIYSPRGRDLMPSNVTGKNSDDRYMKKTLNFSTDSQSELARLGLKELEQLSLPKVSYEVKGYFEGLNIGDTVRIYDKEFTPMLMLEARVSKVEICFTDKSNSKITFSNFIELKSEIDPALIAKMQELAEQNKVYNAQILTDNTVVFKNNTGETTLIARVLDGIKDITDTLTITWLKGDVEVGNGKNLRVSAADVNGVQLYRFNAFKDGKLIAQTQISVADVVDGVDGQPGRDGITYYTWLKYADSPTSGMSDSPTGKTYIGLAFNKTTPNESNNYSDYQWSLIKGADGVQGPPGTNGQTTYVWLKYADNASGSGMSDNPTGKSYIGFAYNKTTVAESTNPSDYTWSKIEGPQGVPGADGENAINAYLTNENITLKADTQGNLKSGQLALASGQMVVVDGPNVITSGVNYSIVNQTGCTATIDSNGNYRLTDLTADSASVIFRASYKGVSLQKAFSINKLYDAVPGQNGMNGQDGKSPIVGYLTNETFIIQTNEDGSLNSESLGNASGFFNIYQGDTKLTNGVAYSIVSQTGVNVTLNAETGNYKVNSMSADFGTAIFKAVYNNVEIQKQLMVVKNKSAIGVVVADTPPEKPMTGQLWKNTGTNNEYTYNTTYYYTGSDWEIYLFYASNIKTDNLAALSANLGKITAGSLQSGTDETNRMLVDLQNKKITIIKKGTGIDPITYLSNKDESLTIEPGKIGYEYGNSTDYQYHSVEMQSRKISLNDNSDTLTISPGVINFAPKSKLNQFQITPENAWELKLATVKYSQSVTLPYGLTGYFERFGRNVYMSIMRKSIYENNFFDAPTGPFIACSEEIPEEFRPSHEVTILLNKFAGSAFYPCALHIKNNGKIYLTNSGSKQNYEITGSGSWAAGYLKNANNDWVYIPTYDNLS